MSDQLDPQSLVVQSLGAATAGQQSRQTAIFEAFLATRIIFKENTKKQKLVFRDVRALNNMTLCTEDPRAP
jgi:hypothetical protein